MSRELLFDPFIGMKDFNQPDNFDPHQLPLMSSVWPSVLIAGAYLLLLRVGPGWVWVCPLTMRNRFDEKTIRRLMKHRRPIEMKTFLALYNIFQVLSCLYYIVNVFRTGFTWSYLWQCRMVGFSNLSHVKLLYFSYILKGIELIETICFVLRKKLNQMSFLHIYHHVSTFVFAYFGVTRVGSKVV